MNSEISELNPATASVLRRFALRRSRLIWIRALAVGLLCFAATMTVVMLVDYCWLLPTTSRLMFSLTGYVLTAATMWWVSLRLLRNSDQHEIAKQLESVDPRLREDLLSAVELSSVDGANGSIEFRERLQRVVARRAAGMDVAKLLPLNLLRAWITAAAIVACLGMILLLIPPLQIGRRIARAMLPGLAIERASITKVEIVRPNPASGFVARGDAVGITAKVSNLTQLGWGQWGSEKGVWMQYRSGDSQMTEIEMTPRTLDARLQGSSDGEGNGQTNEYAANVMMGQSPVQYRIVAGDAVTLWNTLTPRSRPRVLSFVKEYVFPGYAQLPTQKVREDHGDLRAIAGTRATVMVEFDEPVKDAVIQFGNRRNKIDLISVDGSTTRFSATIAIESSSQYQIDAVSQRSGLSNPFGRHYSIVPVVDSPPIVRWDESMAATAVVSPIEVVSLSAEIVDDLPIERVLQKTVVNGKPLDAVPVNLDTEGRRHFVSLQWDLFAIGKKLSVGDLVQTRLVAIDRRGQMSDSEVLEFLIAEKGFDSQRHDSLDRLHQLTSAIHDWFKRAKPATEGFDAKSQLWKGLDADTDAVIGKIEAELSIADPIADTDLERARVEIAQPMEQIGKAIIDWHARSERLRWVSENELRQESLDIETGKLVRQLELIDDEARALFSHAMAVGVIGDAISLRRALTPLLDTDSGIPAARYPRYLNMLAGRLDAMETLIGSHASLLQASTLAHIGKWSDWSDRWTTVLRDLSEKRIKTEDDAKRMLGRLTLFELELRQQTRHSLLDGQLVSSLSQNSRELDRITWSISEAIGDVIPFGTNEKHYAQAVADLSSKLSSEVSLHRNLPDVDLRYAADLNLVKRAMEAFGGGGFVAVDDESAEQVHENIASAIRLLTAAHRVEVGRRDVARLAMAEERLSDTALIRIDHPARLEHFSVRMEHAVGLLKQAGVDWSRVEPIDRSRFGADYAEARSRITRRRWSDDAMQSAAPSLSQIRDQLRSSLTLLKPLIDDARSILLKYAPSIAELAEAAVEDVEQNDSSTKSDDVIEALHDFANTADLMDRDRRELARDADSAAAQIQSAQRKLENAKAQDADAAEAESAMEELAAVLRSTAEHFNNADHGNDLSESRQELRRREQEMDLGDDLDQLAKRTESIAEAAAKMPQELLQQLEQQLQRNEAMQDELSEIAKRSQDAVKRELENLVADENDINQSLEASDPEIRERKRRVARELTAISRRLDTIQEALVAGAQRSSDWGNLGETRDDLKVANATLADAEELLEASKGEKDSMETISETAKRAADAVARIAEAMNSVAETAEKKSDENLHQNEDARSQQQQSLQRFERDARRRQISGHRIAESLWKGEKNSSKQRANMNNRLRSESQRLAKRLRQIARKADADSQTPKELQRHQDQLNGVLEKAINAERAMKAAEDTERFANERIEEAIANRKQLERQGIELLDMPNPAAQLAQRMAATATEELKAIEKLLSDAAFEMDASDDLVADPKQARELSDRQASVSDDIQRAADDLRRISRHEERLGENAAAKRLSGIAKEIEQGAKVAAENAESDLRDAAESLERSPQANRQIAAAAKEIASVGQRLSGDAKPDAIGNVDDQDQQANRSDRQLAQTLDELDRSIARSEGIEDGSESKPSSAGEASPTLSSALQSMAQQVARRRQQSTKPGESGKQSSSTGKPSTSTDQSAGAGPQSGDPSNEQGMPGDPPGGASVAIDGVDRQGSEWGQLRSRSDENSGQAQRALVPNQYRQEIEAYFRAIARERRSKP